jgi:hypothetical protein
MMVFAFDPSKSTGWAVRHLDRDHSAIRCGVFEMPKGADQYYTGDQIGLKVKALVKEHGKPDFAVLEEQSLAKIGNTSADAMIYPWVATAAIVSTLANFGVPYGTLPSVTWRNSFFGRGYKPPFKIVKLKKPDKKGRTEKVEYLWKEACVTECERLGIVLPPQKTISHNAAEACALAICAQVKDTKIHAKRYEPALMALRMARNSRPADLFGGAAA